VRQKVDARRIRGLADELGLTSAEAEVRREAYGTNDILDVVGNPWRELAGETAKDPMIWFLVGTAVLYLALGSTPEALVLLVALVPLVCMDFYLHRRTQASTTSLNRLLADRAVVLRDGVWIDVAATMLVPGDLTRVASGQPFPADGLIVAADEVQVDESSLTGEAYPVRKQPGPPLPADVGEPLVDGPHWGFAGARVLTGTALLRVVFTGEETLYGAIVRSATRGTRAPTPLQRAVADLVRTLLVAAVALCIILAAVRLRQGHGLLDAVVSAATLAVAALPEEFPVVLTVFLGTGVFRLARRHALVRRAVSVENIGRVSCICSDKTGTITEGRLRLERLVPERGVNPERLLAMASLASRGDTGDPIDTTILEQATEERLTHLGRRVIATFPFTEVRRRETSVLQIEGATIAVSKGSPEVILDASGLGHEARESWLGRIRELASGGRKIIACASRALDESWPGGEPDRGFDFLGALVFEDPPRNGVKEAIAACRESGIRVVMITGDHPETAGSVARAIGLGATPPKVIRGDELEGLSVDELARRLAEVDVIARAMPAQKLSLVAALQSEGEIVMVTGDGVNDVPALRVADVGVAMGERGTRAAREVASIVLLDDNFTSIVHAIAEGRQLFRNLKLSFQYLLTFHIPLVFTAAFIPLAGYPLLYLPIHIVFLEALIHPTALLAFQDSPAAGILGRVERSREVRFFDRADWLEVILVGTLGTLLIAFGYDRSLGATVDVEHARGIALVALTSFGGALTAILSGLRSRAAQVLCAASLVLAVVVVQVPFMASRVHVKPLHLDDWAVAGVGGILAVVIPRLVTRWTARKSG
jgi:Ca2+-transporting ATPase